ncbi:MAG: hypothetical protein K8S23_12200 [Candidatus Cloacimonetes bacterium]|nr:hypothetical protein [Candidatus Cloacimonadota bacterium]
MNVTESIDIPQNVTISINGCNIEISWDEVSGANSYKIYTSDDPYGIFTEVSSSGTFVGTSWSKTIFDDLKFYYVVASQDITRDNIYKQRTYSNKRISRKTSISQVSPEKNYKKRILKDRKK